MPSRRTLLAATAAAAAPVLAGCSGGESLPRARPADEPRPPDGATVVATDGAFIETPHGPFRQESAVREYADSRGETRLHLSTRHQLVPGTDGSDAPWKLAGLTVDHDYHAVAPTGATATDASYVPVGDGSTGVRLALADGSETPDLVDRWLVRFDPASPATWGPTFVTEVSPGVTFRAGDALASTRLAVRAERRWFDGAETELTTDLTYGRDG